jgi:hypothetical protein
MDMHSLVKEFSEWRNAEVGQGPEHPTHPNPELKAAVDGFLEEYPFLYNDAGYVEFLKSYAGAHVNWPDDELVVDIFGFTEVSTEFTEGEDPIIDKEGYLTFCLEFFRVQPGSEIESIQILTFAFDATLQRRPGIYRQVVGKRPGDPVTTAWYCDTFLEFLRDLIDKQGRLL